MSPYLFVLYMEKLALIQEKVDAQVWEPVSISISRPKVSHLCFSNECLLFIKETSSQAMLIKQTLDAF